MKASILLEDGTHIIAQAIGAQTQAVGELVFNTAMTGYEEVLSDPSYLGQMVLFTNSYIGNTGINYEDHESPQMYAEALICKNISPVVDNQRAKTSLENYLKEKNKMALHGVDTRFLTQKLREKGCLMAICSALEHDPKKLMEILTHSANLKTENQTERYCFAKNRVQSNKHKLKIAVIDFGIKQGILDGLVNRGAQVELFSYRAKVEDIEAIQADGFFLSNGPGDPKVLSENSGILNVIRTLSQKIPTFGICLGHQLLALAYGENTTKLSHGHHAVNHPVKCLFPKKNQPEVYITSQNHNYVVELTQNIFEVTHMHLNDNTIAGMRHKTLPVFSVQFHPESNPGPHDARELFDDFFNLMKG